jgi:hypothetical protein
MKYRVIIEQDEDGVFVAEVPALPGCISQGKTRAEALKQYSRSNRCLSGEPESAQRACPSLDQRRIVEVAM